MISAYVVFLLVWAMVLTHVWITHHFWLGVAKEHQAEEEANERHQLDSNSPLMASSRELPTPARSFPETSKVDAHRYA